MGRKFLLIAENDEQNFEILKEEIPGAVGGCNAKRQIKIRGPYFMSEKENSNHRSYPYELARKNMDWYINERVNPMAAYGELDHPDRFDVKMDKACHCVTSLREENKMWIGESIILTGFPCGDMVASLINHGLKFGISSRGAGQLSESKSTVSEYYISCFDVVPNPSIARFVDGILESKEFMLNTHGIIVESTFNQFGTELHDLPRHSADRSDKVANAISNFMKALRNT